ncbi:MAG: terminase [Firmicutes bacterium]|nr:terminase [Bacillota bacterium]
MSKEKLILSPKYKAFLKCKAPVEFLEGTTMAGKTTVGIFKFMLKVAASPKKLHIIAADDTGTAEKNIINKDLGILDNFGALAEYKGNGSGAYKMPHIVFKPKSGEKIIFIVGYGNRRKWKDVLGGQYGCVYIDEINTADMDFVREISIRCDYLQATLNPDDPNLPIYKEYVNCSRPLAEWGRDTPKEILDELKEEPKDGWIHWFFSFDHNLGLTETELKRVLSNVPKGTKIWKNKVKGERGKATGLVFPTFDRKKHVVRRAWVKEQVEEEKLIFKTFTAGLDTSYSQESDDTIAMIFKGITTDGIIYSLEEKVYNNKKLTVPIAPSDTAKKFVEFLDYCGREWGISRNTFVDSADQATITELKKYKRETGCLYIFNDSYKKVKIVDRINLTNGWIQNDAYYICDSCPEQINEMETYSWKEGKDEPEDKNDHTINADQYAWIPYRDKIGVKKK